MLSGGHMAQADHLDTAPLGEQLPHLHADPADYFFFPPLPMHGGGHRPPAEGRLAVPLPLAVVGTQPGLSCSPTRKSPLTSPALEGAPTHASRLSLPR